MVELKKLCVLLTLVGGGAATLALGPWPLLAQPRVSVPALVSASVDDPPPWNLADPGNRVVEFRLVTAGRPVCAGSGPSTSLGFVIDTDRNATTGRRIEAFRELGADTRASITCDRRLRQFTSPLGPVVVSAGDRSGESVVLLQTTARRLPALEFRWVAFVTDGQLVDRIPTSSYGYWAIFERTFK